MLSNKRYYIRQNNFMAAILSFAFHPASNRVIPIGSATNGLACGCICLECGQPLEAVQGEVRDQHFRHATDKGCKGGGEGLLHLRCKQLICNGTIMAITGRQITYHSPQPEYKLGAFRTDVTVWENSVAWHIEVVFKHSLSLDKENFYRSNGHRVIVIDMSDVDPNISDELLVKVLCSDTENKSVLYPYPKEQHTESPWVIFQWILGILAFVVVIAFIRKRAYR